MNGSVPVDKRDEAERRINALIADISTRESPQSADVGALLTQISDLSKQLFGEGNRYLRAAEPDISLKIDLSFASSPISSREWEGRRHKMLTVCYAMLFEVESSGFMERSSTA